MYIPSFRPPPTQQHASGYTESESVGQGRNHRTHMEGAVSGGGPNSTTASAGLGVDFGGIATLSRLPRRRFDRSGPPPPTSNPDKVVLSTTLHPIYFLFVSPPAVASIAWCSMSGRFDVMAKSLFFIAAWLYAFFVLGNWSFLRTASFSVAWWAYSFPCELLLVLLNKEKETRICNI